MNTSHTRLAFLFSTAIFWSSFSFAQVPPGDHWTELHWLEWQAFVEDSWVPGQNDEETYWRIRSTAEHFGVLVPEMGVDFGPPPDFGGGSGIGDEQMRSAVGGRKPGAGSSKAMICIGYPDGINPCQYHSADPPPQAAVTLMAGLGGALISTGTPYGRAVGGAFATAAWFFQIWIDLEEQGDDDDE